MLIMDGQAHTLNECIVSEIMEEYDEPNLSSMNDAIRKAVWEIQKMEDEHIMKILDESNI